MEIINEAMPEEPEPKKQQQFEPDTAESGGVASDSGIYDAIRRSCSDDQSSLLFDNVSSIKDFRKSQRVKKITQQPRFLECCRKKLYFKFFVKCNRHLVGAKCNAEEYVAIDHFETQWR